VVSEEHKPEEQAMRMVIRASQDRFARLVGQGTAAALWDENGVDPQKPILMEGRAGGHDLFARNASGQAQSLPILDNLDPAY